MPWGCQPHAQAALTARSTARVQQQCLPSACSRQGAALTTAKNACACSSNPAPEGRWLEAGLVSQLPVFIIDCPYHCSERTPCPKHPGAGRGSLPLVMPFAQALSLPSGERARTECPAACPCLCLHAQATTPGARAKRRKQPLLCSQLSAAMSKPHGPLFSWPHLHPKTGFPTQHQAPARAPSRGVHPITLLLSWQGSDPHRALIQHPPALSLQGLGKGWGSLICHQCQSKQW